jgi:hypothetical protein
MARAFDAASGDKISFGSSASLDNLTACSASMFIRVTTNASGYLFSKGDIFANADRLRFRFDGTGIEFYVAFDSGFGLFRGTTAAPSTGAWHHVGMSWGGVNAVSNIRIFFDGVEATYSGGGTGAGNMADDSAYNLAIGDRDFGGRAMDGRMADFRLWNYALSPEELNAARLGARVRQDRLVGWWPLWGVQSPEPDWSGNGNHGTPTGTARVDHPPMTSLAFMLPNRLVVNHQVPTAWSKTLDEVVQGIDAASRGITRTLATDTVSGVDSAVKGPGKRAVEVATAIDSMVKIPGKVLTDVAVGVDLRRAGADLFEEIHAVETVIASIQFQKTLSEVVHADDSITRGVGKTVGDTATAADSMETIGGTPGPARAIITTKRAKLVVGALGSQSGVYGDI